MNYELGIRNKGKTFAAKATANSRVNSVVNSFVFVLCLFCFAGLSHAADIKVISSSANVSPGDSFYIDIVVENIPPEGLGAVQFRLNVDAPGSEVIPVPNIEQPAADKVSVVSPLIIGAPTSGRSGLGDFFLAAAGPNGILVMDNESITNGTGLYTFGHTNGSTPPTGSGTVARFYFSVGKDINATDINITLSDVMLLDTGTVYPLGSNTGAAIELRCLTNVPDLAGLSESDARAALQAAALLTGNIYELDNHDKRYLTDIVLAQSYASGMSVLCNTPVDLAVNTVPYDVSGAKADDKANDESGTAVISWGQSLSQDVAGYRISLVSGPQGQLMEINDPASTGTVITGLPVGVLSQLKITVFDRFGNESRGTVITAKPIDDIAPRINITGVQEGGLYRTDVLPVISIQEANISSSEITLNNAPYSLTPISSDNNYLLKVAVTDVSGGSAAKEVRFAVDKTPPGVEATPAGSAFNGSISVALNANESGIIYYTLDGSEPAVNSLSYSLPLRVVSSTTLKFIAVDTAGNISAVKTEEYTFQDYLVVNVATDEGRLLKDLRVYAFKESGSYTGLYSTTGEDGNVKFNLAKFVSGNYKFRVDYDGYQFWFGPIAMPATLNTKVIIAEEKVEVALAPAFAGVRVYLFTQSGSYLSQYKVTDGAGKSYFDLPVGKAFKFRADNMGRQYWSNVFTVSANVTNSVTVALGGGHLQLTVQKSVGSPLAGIKTYLFSQSGSYFGKNGLTDSNGAVAFDISGGMFKVRADYLGYQFWTPDIQVSGDINTTLNIPHKQLTVKFAGLFRDTYSPLAGIKTYLYNSSGSYAGLTRNTDSNGNILFELPAKEYKVRADYLGQKFWSGVFNSEDASVNIPMSEARVKVIGNGLPLGGIKIYVFTASGSYLGFSGVTGDSGEATFRVPAGKYKFRADFQVKHFWSDETALVADDIKPIVINTGGGSFVLTVTKQDNTPLQGVRCYVYDEGGPYIGMNGVTDSQGKVAFGLSDGPYQFRIDYLGNHLWTEVVAVPATLKAAYVIEHHDVGINVQGKQGDDLRPGVNIPVYLFSPSGQYLSVKKTTDSSGKVSFNLPGDDYRVRVDYMGQKYWSGDFQWQDTSVIIPEGTAQAHVRMAGRDIVGGTVYVYDSKGSYLGLKGATGTSGSVSFRLPEGAYKFRSDYQGQKFWASAEITADDLNDVYIRSDGARFKLRITDGEGPLAGVKVYAFNSGKSYLGMYAVTDDTGQVSFDMVEGSFTFRVDYLGYQYWTGIETVPSTVEDTMTIPHKNIKVTTEGVMLGQPLPLNGMPLYLFTASGSYLSVKKVTDENGAAVFYLPDAGYKVRMDYLGQQFWSEPFQFSDAGITISEGIVRLHIYKAGANVTGAKVYLYSKGGAYLGQFRLTDASGIAEFVLPDRDFKFRIDSGSVRKWTDVIDVIPDQVNEAVIDLN